MEVFITWSGKTSRAIAEELYGWLPTIIDNVQPWMSDVNIDKGSRWYLDIAKALERAKYGLICFTPANLKAAWILFEAGALAKSLSEAYVVPLLFEVSVQELPESLQLFQATQLRNKDDFKKLLKNLNRATVDDNNRGRAESIIERRFEALWPTLESRLTTIASESTEARLASKAGSGESADALSIQAISKLDELYAAVSGLKTDTLKYWASLEQQDPRQLAQQLEQKPEAAYLFNARRFGGGHVNASFTCEIHDDGSANVRRDIEVEVFSRLSSLDAYLVLPSDDADAPRDASLVIDKLMPSTSAPRIKLDIQETGSKYQNATNLTFTPPLRPGEKLSYSLTERGMGSVFLMTAPPSDPAQAERATEFFGWSIDRPTKRLELKVVFPPGYETTAVYPEVRRASSSGFSNAIIQESETIRVDWPSLSEPDEHNRRTLSMVVEYPMTGLVYTVRWELVDSWPDTSMPDQSVTT